MRAPPPGVLPDELLRWCGGRPGLRGRWRPAGVAHCVRVRGPHGFTSPADCRVPPEGHRDHSPHRDNSTGGDGAACGGGGERAGSGVCSEPTAAALPCLSSWCETRGSGTCFECRAFQKEGRRRSSQAGAQRGVPYGACSGPAAGRRQLMRRILTGFTPQRVVGSSKCRLAILPSPALWQQCLR